MQEQLSIITLYRHPLLWTS